MVHFEIILVNIYHKITPIYYYNTKLYFFTSIKLKNRRKKHVIKYYFYTDKTDKYYQQKILKKSILRVPVLIKVLKLFNFEVLVLIKVLKISLPTPD